jgi:hypothetical protein
MKQNQDKRFDLFLKNLAQDLSDGLLICREIHPTLKGDLVFNFQHSSEKFIIILKNLSLPVRDRLTVNLRDQQLILYNRNFSNTARKILMRTKEGLSSILNDEKKRKWIDRRNRNINEVIRTKEGFLDIFSDIIFLKEFFWNTWFIDDIVELDPDVPDRLFKIVLREISGISVELTFDAKGTGTEGLLMNYPLGNLLIGLDERPVEMRKMPENSPETAIGYIIAKGVHHKMKWIERNVEAATAQDRFGIPKMGLIENCFRCFLSWRGNSSHFFNSWGDIDHFGIMAAANIDRKINFVAHSNRECSFSKYFLSKNIKSGSSPFRSVSLMKSMDIDNIFLTDISDSAIVSGGEHLLEEAIEQSKHLYPDRTISVVGNCDYYMIGDNINSVCEKCRGRETKIMYLNPPMAGFQEVKTSNWWGDFLTSISHSDRKIKNSINMAGLGNYDETHMIELKILLERAGIKLLTVILPGVSPEAYTQFAQAEFTVLSKWHPIRKVFEEPLKDHDFKYISLPCPYGIQGTKIWINEIAKALKMPEFPDEKFSQFSGKFAPDYEKIKNRLKSINLAIVADVGTIEELFSPEFFFGFDPCLFFTELGVNLKIIKILDDEKDASIPVNFNNPQVEFIFSKRSETCYSEIFRKYSINLVYCDVCDGEIVKKSGATPFAIDSLFMGISGARKTMQKLLALSKLNIYSKYGRQV